MSVNCELRGKLGNKLKEPDRTDFCKPIKGLQGLGDYLCTEWFGWMCLLTVVRLPYHMVKTHPASSLDASEVVLQQ